MTPARHLVLSLILLSGCSSIERTFCDSRRGEIHPYMGSVHTVEFAAGDGLFAGHPLAYAIAAVDLPFSFVADTLFLPYTLPVWLRDRNAR